MQLPADLTRSTLLVTTSAVANTSVTTANLASPGAGLRYRVWWVGLSFTNTAQAPLNTRIVLLTTSGASRLPRLSSADFRSVDALFPGGFPWDTNQGIDVAHQSSVVSMQINVTILYTIEAVS
jgi:hypothetical protein